MLGGASCSLVQYEVSVRLVCRTAAVSRQQRVSVLVGNAAGYSEAAQRFAFKVSREAVGDVCLAVVGDRVCEWAHLNATVHG